MTNFIPVLDIAQLSETGSVAVEAHGKSILICRSGEHFHAIANRCSHQQQPLEGGHMRGRFIACPFHGVRFDLQTGMPLGTLTKTAIAVYPLRIVDDRIEVADLPPG